MPVALEHFVKQLADSGVIAPGKLENFIPPKAFPKDPQELARQLVQSKHLTKFQAQEIYAGRSRSLILGNYTILDKIGAGGMGQVFKAEHRRLKRIVAIKMLPATTTKDAAAVARFQREVEAAAKLRHPNIVATDDSDEANGVHFLVMECVEGSDLSELVKKNGRLSVAKAVNYILQAARGLEFAHGEGVVHRDIKPANLLLDKKGTVKILDMGLARIDSDGDTATQAELTGTGMVLGTVDYMAPEQALSTKHVDGRADIYSLGCSLHYLITARATYNGDTLMAKLLAHREQPIPALGADVPEEIQAVFQKMVAKKVKDRYQTMSEVVAALEQGGFPQQTSVSFQQSVSTDLDADVLTFLRDAPPQASHIQKKAKKAAPVKTAKKAAPTKPGKDNKKLILGAVGAGFLGLAILAGVIFKLRTQDGTLVVEINQPDAVVQVSDTEGKVEVSQPGGKAPVSISVDPGKHRLKVEKDGFKFFAKDFEMESGGTRSIKAQLIPLDGKPAAAAKNQALAFNTPGFDQWIKMVAAMPAEQQVEAVSKKLRELNPGFDGKEEHKVMDGVVTDLEFPADNVTDISPVRALVGLKSFSCSGSGVGKGKLSSLSPLKGMKLTNLVCNWSPSLFDLLPLRDMKLTSLNCNGTQVADLSPLQGMPLESLDCSSTQVSTLSPLEGMQLTWLHCFATKVSDLSPLKGMPLLDLASQQTNISDLSPLKGMLLNHLSCGNTQVFDLSPVNGMPLTGFGCPYTNVSNLSPLTGMPLTEVWCNGTQVSDLSPLQGNSLATLHFTPKNIAKGLNIIRNMKSIRFIGFGKQDETFPPAEFWKRYDAGEFGKPDSTAATPDHKPITNINDPAFQQWMKTVAALPAKQQVEAVAKKLQELNTGFDGKVTHRIENGVVTVLGFRTDNVIDISPVRALVGLEALDCGGTWRSNGRLSDLSPLRGMRLKALTCGNTQVLELMPLNGMKLSKLDLSVTPVPDLSPLVGTPLTELYVGLTGVSDLSPVRGMPLTHLSIDESKVSDLSSLVGMNLASIIFTPKSVTKRLDAIRKMQSLTMIGVTSDKKWATAEFWKKYDAGEFNK